MVVAGRAALHGAPGTRITSPASVNITLDNTAGNLASGAVTVSLVAGGSAAEGADYNTTSTSPPTFSSASWPAPGSAVTQTVDLVLIADGLEEADQTIELNIGDRGPWGGYSTGRTGVRYFRAVDENLISRLHFETTITGYNGEDLTKHWYSRQEACSTDSILIRGA